jgi:hypothetical protein
MFIHERWLLIDDDDDVDDDCDGTIFVFSVTQQIVSLPCNNNHALFLGQPRTRTEDLLQDTCYSVLTQMLMAPYTLSYTVQFNLLKTERRPLHLKAQSVPRCKHFSSRK